MLSSPGKPSQKGSALLIVLVIALVALASLVGIATFRKSAIPSSPASYQAQIVSATPTPSPIAYVQSNSTVPGNNLSTISTAYSNAQTQGNLNVIIIGWQGTAASIKSVTDTQGNTYAIAIGITKGSGLSQAIYYAKNIKAGSNTATVTFDRTVNSPDLMILEYSGLDTLNPLNATHAQTGQSASASSGQAANITAGELLIGAGVTNRQYTAPGSSYTQRIITNPNARSIAEDRIVNSSGSYDASASLNLSTAYYVMQIATFKPAPAPSATPTPTPTPYTYSQSSYYAYSQAAYVTPTPTPCLTSTASWQSTAIISQTGSFEATYDDTPSSNLMDGVMDFSTQNAAAYTDLAIGYE